MSLEQGKRVLAIEAKAIAALIDRLDQRFSQAVDILLKCQGKVVVSGMGKSGLIGQKIAATLASTGTPAFFLHPAEGIHGDLGMVGRQDVLVALSNSGETEEVLKLLPFMKRLGLPVIAFTGRMQSTLANNADVVLDVSVSEEACPLGLAPTASTTATLAMGDALAIALLQERGFREEDFAQYHPGGALGKRLLVKVRDVMHAGDQIPRILQTKSLREAVLEITSKKLGMTTVMDEQEHLVGIITDGDLRRFFETGGAMGGDWSHTAAGDIGSRSPRTISPDDLAAKAVQIMEQYTITALVAVDDANHIAGVVHLHDLLKSGII
jgi:arabinose-5-phosphate isomerase